MSISNKYSNLLETGILNSELISNNINQFNDYFESFKVREIYIKDFGYFLVSQKFINSFKDIFINEKILEVGSGSGFLAKSLQDVGLDITPTDKSISKNEYSFNKTYTDIIETDSVKYLSNNKNIYSTVLMSWPNYDNSFAFNVAKNMKSKQKLIYIGESFGGCTANDDFFDLLEVDFKLDEKITQKLSDSVNSWNGIHDSVYVYIKN